MQAAKLLLHFKKCDEFKKKKQGRCFLLLLVWAQALFYRALLSAFSAPGTFVSTRSQSTSGVVNAPVSGCTHCRLLAGCAICQQFELKHQPLFHLQHYPPTQAAHFLSELFFIQEEDVDQSSQGAFWHFFFAWHKGSVWSEISLVPQSSWPGPADSSGISTPGAGSPQLWASPKCSTHLPLREANPLNKQGTCSGKIEYFVNSVDRGDGNFIPNTNSWEFMGEEAQPMSSLIKEFTSSFYFLLQSIFSFTPKWKHHLDCRNASF